VAQVLQYNEFGFGYIQLDTFVKHTIDISCHQWDEYLLPEFRRHIWDSDRNLGYAMV
jgi:hypothetical protein